MTCRTINGKPTLTGDYEHDIEQCRCRIDDDTALLRECRSQLRRFRTFANDASCKYCAARGKTHKPGCVWPPTELILARLNERLEGKC